MYKHLLLPTDGSKLSQEAIAAGMKLAKSIGARVTGLHVVADMSEQSLEPWANQDVNLRPHLRALRERQAVMNLEFIENAARNAGIEYDGHFVHGVSPFEAIVKAAEERGCDLIFMASHGWKGTEAVVLASETMKVLTHSSIPVLVHR